MAALTRVRQVRSALSLRVVAALGGKSAGSEAGRLGQGGWGQGG